MLTVTAQTYTKFSGVSPGNNSIQSTSKLFFLSACRVSYCVADPNFTKVFAFISRVQGKHDLNCYAFLCSKESMVSRKWAQSYCSPPRSGALWTTGGNQERKRPLLPDICWIVDERKDQLPSLLRRGLLCPREAGERGKKKARGGRWKGEKEDQ